uniref:(California timema) hypothetical protein n=1 Tax=Timema californicum TaxID=61474 RepID=A0A7R9J8L0_TIMCA|nr:unnamed protein product [Timema californicum]
MNVNTQCIVCLQLLQRRRTSGSSVSGKHTVYRMSAATPEEKDEWIKCVRYSRGEGRVDQVCPVNTQCIVCLQLLQRRRTSGSSVSGKHTVYRVSAATPEEKDEWIKCVRQSISHNPFYDMLSARKKKAQKTSSHHSKS